MKKVINGETMMVLETFEEKDTQNILNKYKSIGKWEDVQTDVDGDIILWEEL